MSDHAIPPSTPRPGNVPVGQFSARPADTDSVDATLFLQLFSLDRPLVSNLDLDDDLAFSCPYMMAAGTSPEVADTIRQCYQLVQQPLPFDRKLGQLDTLVRQAGMTPALKGNDKALSELRNAAGAVTDKLCRDEVKSIQAAEDLSSEQRQQRLEQVLQAIEDLPWLSARAKAGLRINLSFAGSGPGS